MCVKNKRKRYIIKGNNKSTGIKKTFKKKREAREKKTQHKTYC